MVDFVDPSSLIDASTLKQFQLVEQTRLQYLENLIVAGLTNVVIEHLRNPVLHDVYLVGQHLFFVFPYAHRKVVRFVGESGLPHAPGDEETLGLVAEARGIGVHWADPDGSGTPAGGSIPMPIPTASAWPRWRSPARGSPWGCSSPGPLSTCAAVARRSRVPRHRGSVGVRSLA